MKATNYRQVLKARGYHMVERTKYQGRNIFVKSHKYWNSYCIIEKDTHGKGQSIIFNITNNQFPKDMVEFKEAEFDIKYYEHIQRVPLEVSGEEVSQIAAAVVQDHNQTMEAQEGKYKEALEGLRDALRGMAKQQDAFLKLCKEFGSLEGWQEEKEKAKLTNDAFGYKRAIAFLYKKCGLISMKEAIELATVLIDCSPLGPGVEAWSSIVSNQTLIYLDSNRYADTRGGFKIY